MIKYLKKNILFLFLLFFFFQIFAKNQIYEFGPKTDSLIIFTASKSKINTETNSTKALLEFIKKIKELPLSIRIMVAITDNDILDLPNFISEIKCKNSQELIDRASEYKSIVTFILDDGKKDEVELIAGVKKKVTPSWLLKNLYMILKKEQLKINFRSNSIMLHRMGLLKSDKILETYLQMDIPAIKISTNINLEKIFIKLIDNYSKKIPKEWDTHYNVKQIFNINIISEKLLVVLILTILFFALFYIFMFSFLFERKKDMHFKDLLKLWRVPFLFFIINIICLYFSEYLVIGLFYLRFENFTTINLYPFLAFTLKFSLTFFFFTIFLIINKHSKLPMNTFIYGYLTSLVCLLNIFIFSGLNLTYSLLFLELYILSFISFYVKKAYFQIILFIAYLVLLLIYFYPIFLIDVKLIINLFYANNFFISCFLVPLNLMVIRIVLRLKRKKIKIRKFVLPVFFGIISIICIFLLFILSFFVNKDSRKITYSIKNNQHLLYDSFSLQPIELNNKNINRLKQLKVDDFFSVSTTFQEYFERSICKIKITPSKELAVINVLISREKGFPIYESNLEFTEMDDGKTVSFLSPINLDEPFEIKFSGEKNANFKIQIIGWFIKNENDLILNTLTLNNKIFFKITKEFLLNSYTGKEIEYE